MTVDSRVRQIGMAQMRGGGEYSFGYLRGRRSGVAFGGAEISLIRSRLSPDV